MRNTQFYKHRISWYRSNRIIKSISKTKRESIEKYVNKTFESLPKYIQNSLQEDKYQNIQAVVNNIIATGEAGVTKPYKALYQLGLRNSRRTKQAKTIFSRFRDEQPSVYAKYNSYMYRLGYSSADYFYKNAEYEGIGSVVTVTLDLPKNMNGIFYELLTIKLNMTGSESNVEADMS